jgi:uncharacterized protein YoxC
MILLNQVLSAILLISAAMLCIALILYIKRIVKSVEDLKIEIAQLNSSIKPLIESTIELAKNLNDVSIEAKDQLKVTKNIIEEIRFRVEKIIEFEESIRVGIEDYTKPFLSNLNALKNGLTAFWRKIKEN